MAKHTRVQFTLPVGLFASYKEVYASFTGATEFEYKLVKGDSITYTVDAYKNKICVLMFYDKKQPELKSKSGKPYVFEPIAVCYVTFTSTNNSDASNNDWLYVVRCRSVKENDNPLYSDKMIHCFVDKGGVCCRFEDVRQLYSATYAADKNNDVNAYLQKLDIKYPSGRDFKGTFFTERTVYGLQYPVHAFYYTAGALAPLPTQKFVVAAVHNICNLFCKFRNVIENKRDDQLYRVADVIQFVLAALLPYKPDRDNFPHALSLQPDASVAQADCEDKAAYGWYLFRLFKAYTGKYTFAQLLKRSCERAQYVTALVTTAAETDSGDGVHAVGMLVPNDYTNTKEWCYVDGMSNTQTNVENKTKYPDYIKNEYVYMEEKEDFVDTSKYKTAEIGSGDVIHICCEDPEEGIVNTYALLQKQNSKLQKLSLRELFVDGLSRNEMYMKPLFAETSNLRNLQACVNTDTFKGISKEFVQRTEHAVKLATLSM